MVDTVSPAIRSRIMRAVRTRSTVPELAVRQAAHKLGLRFRLHQRDLPGTPDIVFPKYRSVVFVHGCFWHQHPKCRRAKLPMSKKKFWVRKLQKNTARDRQAIVAVRQMGWRVLVVWECQTRQADMLSKILARFFRLHRTRIVRREVRAARLIRGGDMRRPYFAAPRQQAGLAK